MPVTIRHIKLQSDDFSPADLYGYDKFGAGEYINQNNGYNASAYNSYFQMNTLFNDMYAVDRANNDNYRANFAPILFQQDFGEGRLEEWYDYTDMTNISPVNHLNIMTYAPIRTLMEQGRIEGFGYDPESIPEDMIGLKLNNGKSYIEDDGSYHKQIYRYSDMPRYSEEELRIFEHQRRMLDLCLQDTNFDPTNTDLERY